MFQQNNFSKYLLYAVGEIVLVVIGILLALQINNWNEERKESKAINNVLIEIKEDLLQDQVSLVRSMAILKGDYAAQKRIIGVLETKSSFNDTVRSDFGHIFLARNIFTYSKGYELLKELNLGTLKDKRLRILLTKYYERDIPNVYQEFVDDKLEFENFWLPYVRQNFEVWEFNDYGIPHDYDAILNDSKLLTATKMNINNLSNTIRALNTALDTASDLIEYLPDEK